MWQKQSVTAGQGNIGRGVTVDVRIQDNADVIYAIPAMSKLLHGRLMIRLIHVNQSRVRLLLLFLD